MALDQSSNDRLSIYLPTYLPTYLSINLPTYLPTCENVRAYIRTARWWWVTADGWRVMTCKVVDENR